MKVAEAFRWEGRQEKLHGQGAGKELKPEVVQATSFADDLSRIFPDTTIPVKRPGACLTVGGSP